METALMLDRDLKEAARKCCLWQLWKDFFAALDLVAGINPA
jgi:hypothetical protein